MVLGVICASEGAGEAFATVAIFRFPVMRIADHLIGQPVAERIALVEWPGEQDEEVAFREPLLACLACGFLLCVCLWVVQRDWGPGAEVTPVPKSEWTGLSLPELLPRLFSQHWPTLLLLLCFVLLVFEGMTWLVFSPRASRVSQTEEPGGNA